MISFIYTKEMILIRNNENNEEKTGGKVKDMFKDKIIIFVIGLLLGAIISTGAFLAYTKTSHNNNGHPPMQMNGGRHSSLPNQNNNNGNNNNGSNNNGQPPEMPENNNNNQQQNTQNENA